MVYKEEIQVYAASRSCTKPVRSLMLSFASRICGNDTFYNLYIYIHTYMYTHIFTYMYRCTERRNSISLWVHCIAYKEKLHAYFKAGQLSNRVLRVEYLRTRQSYSILIHPDTWNKCVLHSLWREITRVYGSEVVHEAGQLVNWVLRVQYMRTRQSYSISMLLKTWHTRELHSI